MHHDFDNESGRPKKLNGKTCYGYMDYQDGNNFGDYTNRWSHCSVRDFKRYVNKQRKFCLKSRGGGGDGSNFNSAILW